MIMEESENHPHHKKKKMLTAYNEESYIEIYDKRYYRLQASKFKHYSTRNHSFDGLWLDFGCGTGLTWEFMRNSLHIQFRYIGCDLSRGMLKKFYGKGGDTHLICTDGENLPIRNNSVSNIISLTTLQNLPNPILGLKEIQRICKIDGMILISVLKKSFSQNQWKKLLESVFSGPNFSINLLNQQNSSNLEDWIYEIQFLRK